MQFTVCVHTVQRVPNVCVNSLIPDTTSDSSNLGDADPAVDSACQSQAVSHC
jgi:hypothetical protein